VAVAFLRTAKLGVVADREAARIPFFERISTSTATIEDGQRNLGPLELEGHTPVCESRLTPE
jgi:hypothetical protein